LCSGTKGSASGCATTIWWWKLRYLFSEDPLALEDNDASQQPFCTWYDLEEDYAEFLATACRVNELAKQEEERRAGAEGTVGDGEVALAEMEPLDPARLGRLEEAITTADVSSLVRRQPVCAIAAGQKPTPIFEEVFVSIDELRRKVLPNVNIVSSRWLFQHLTEVLDRRLLQCLPEMEAETPANTSININVSTILSEQFLTFDRRLRHYTKKTVFLELQSVDVFADMGAYFFARDFARERGYMICLDGLGYLTFPMAPRDELGTDMQKLIWDADVLDQGSTTRADRLREAVKKAGPTRVILCRCDDHRALEFGQQIGISLFQGRYIDRIAQFIR
jgi:hypothetical protein